MLAIVLIGWIASSGYVSTPPQALDVVQKESDDDDNVRFGFGFFSTNCNKESENQQKTPHNFKPKKTPGAPCYASQDCDPGGKCLHGGYGDVKSDDNLHAGSDQLCLGTCHFCESQGCGVTKPPAHDAFATCHWSDDGFKTISSGKNKPVGCAYCHESSCVDKKPSGETCDDKGECQSNDCRDGFCHGCEFDGCGALVESPGADKCSWTKGATGTRMHFQKPGCTRCVRGKCVQKILDEEEEECDQNEECLSNVCREKKCKKKKGLGEACSDDQKSSYKEADRECLSNFCFKGKCKDDQKTLCEECGDGLAQVDANRECKSNNCYRHWYQMLRGAGKCLPAGAIIVPLIKGGDPCP